MKRRHTLSAISGIAAFVLAALPAAARPIDNRTNPDGTPVLIPAVKKYEARNGATALPRDFAIAAPAAADNEAEVLASLVKRYFPDLAVRRSESGGFCRLELAENGVPESPEGYTLEIDGRGVLIRSRDVRGLYYGVRTLGNLLRNAATPEIPQCRIADWPDLKIRGMFLNMRHQGFDGCLPEILSEIDAAGALKYNYLMLEFGEKFPYKDNPFTQRENGYSIEDVEAIKAAAKRNHIEIIPMLQILSHDAWLHAHPRYWQDIAEGKPGKKWSSGACPLSEVTREVQLMAIREQIEFFKPGYFNLSMDEIAQCPWGVCKRCRGKDPKQLWQDATRLYTGEVLKHGVRPILFHDMYYAGNPVGGDEMLPTLDKKVVFCNWDYGLELRKSRFPFFKRAGFQLFSMSYCERMDNMRVLPVEVLKQGCDGVFLSFWGNFRYPSHPGLVNGRGLAGFTLGGGYEWNTRMAPPAGISFDAAWETLRLILPDRCPEAPATMRFAPLPLDRAFNTKLGRDRRFPMSTPKIVGKMKREAARTTEKFHIAAADDAYFAAVVGGSEALDSVTIPVDSSFEWLGIAAVAGSSVGEPSGRPVVATLTVRYADGSEENIPLAYRKELPLWNYDGGGYGVRRFSTFNDRRGALVNLYAKDWRNPHPDKAVREIVLSAPKKSVVPVALLALSLGGGGSAAAPDDKAAARRLTKWSDPAAFRPVSADTPGSVVLSNYEGGKLRNARVSLSGNPNDKKMAGAVLSGKSRPESCFVGKLTYRIVEDPGCPSGKALKLSIPALKPEYSHLRCRLIVDMRFDRKQAGEINTFFFDFKTTHPWFVEWPAVYLMNSKPFGAAAYMGDMEGRRDRNWHHVAVPYRLFKQDKRPLDLARADTIRLSFFMRELTEPSEIYIGTVGVSPVETEMLAPLRGEKVPERPGERPGELFFID